MNFFMLSSGPASRPLVRVWQDQLGRSDFISLRLSGLRHSARTQIPSTQKQDRQKKSRFVYCFGVLAMPDAVLRNVKRLTVQHPDGSG